MKVNQSNGEIQHTLCQKLRLIFNQCDLHGVNGQLTPHSPSPPWPFLPSQFRIHSLSDNTVSELQELQSSTASFASSFQGTLQSSASQLHAIQPRIQQLYNDLATSLTSTVNELASIIKQKDLPVHEKVSRVSTEVRDSVTPLLEAVRKGISDLLAQGKSQASEIVGTDGQRSGIWIIQTDYQRHQRA